MPKKLAVITGGSRGIGRAIAEKFAAQGFDIVLTAKDAHTLMSAQSAIEAKFKVNCFIKPADLSQKSEVLALGEWIVSLRQPIAVLVNNAGVFLPGNIHEESDGTLEKLIETNLYSAYYLTKAIMPIFLEQHEGHVFNVCSVASLKAYPNGGSYSISKFALLGFSKGLREELKDEGIKVTSLIPGAVYTDSWVGAGISKERFMTVEDVAEVTWSAFSLSKNALVEEIILRPLSGDI